MKIKGGNIVEKWQEAHSETENQDWTSRLCPEELACRKAEEKRGSSYYQSSAQTKSELYRLWLDNYKEEGAAE